MFASKRSLTGEIIVTRYVNLASDAVSADIKTVCSSLGWGFDGGFATAGQPAEETCLGFNRSDSVGAASSGSGALEAGQHSLADRPVTLDLWLFWFEPRRDAR